MDFDSSSDESEGWGTSPVKHIGVQLEGAPNTFQTNVDCATEDKGSETTDPCLSLVAPATTRSMWATGSGERAGTQDDSEYPSESVPGGRSIPRRPLRGWGCCIVLFCTLADNNDRSTLNTVLLLVSGDAKIEVKLE